MDNGDGDPSSGDSGKQLAIASTIKPTDMISQEAYQANLQHIQLVKEMVRKVETNNEAAHRRFLVDQLEKRAKEGRDAEEQLARLKSQQVTPDLVQFTPIVPTDNVVPTTATLVEIPESRPSLSRPAPAPVPAPVPVPAPATTFYPPQLTSYRQHHPNNLRYYVPSDAAHQSSPHTVQLPFQTPIDSGQTGRRTAQNVPVIGNTPASQTSFQIPQPTQPWSPYPPQPIVLPTMSPVLHAGYSVPSAGWGGTVPVPDNSSTGSSNPVFYQPGYSTSFTVSQPPVATHGQSQSLPSTSQAQFPHQGVSFVPMFQPLPIQSHSQPTNFRQPPHQFQPQPQQPSQSLLQPQQPPHSAQVSHQQPPTQPPQPQRRQRRQPPKILHQPQPQGPLHPQPPQRSQPPNTLHQQQSQPTQTSHQQYQAQSSSQRPLQLAETNPHASSQSTDRAHFAQLPQSTNGQGKIQTSEQQLRFTRLFQAAAQRDFSHLKAVWVQARAVGISEEWIEKAVKSLPPDLLQSLMAHARQSESNAHAPPIPNVTAVDTPIPQAVVSAISVAEQPTGPSAPTEPTLPQYNAQLQYYAAQATRLAFSAQVAETSTSTGPSENPTLTQAMPKRDVSQTGVSVRTPKDANKATLARDILRSLGMMVPQPGGSEPTGQNDEHEDLPREITVLGSPSCATSSERPLDLPVSFVDGNLALIRLEKPDEPRRAASQSELKEEKENTVIDGPIMIDLTIDDSDGSVDENGQEPTPNRTIACATSSSQPVSVVPESTIHTPPLLDSLSLEESSIEVTVEDHKTDVPMDSPPLSFAAELEENMESELLYPPPANAEAILPSFEPPPREASAHPPDGKLPLFLPSPPVSPADSKPRETDTEIIVNKDESGASLKRRSMGVDDDVHIVTPPRVSKRRKVAYVLIPPAPPYVGKARLKGYASEESVDSELDGVGADEEIQYSRFEQLLIEESKSRLLERRCRWSNCGAILNCATHLLSHLKKHAREEELKGAFLCQWAKCQRQFDDEREGDVHLERHTIRPLPCPFAGCDDEFDKPVQVMQHEVQHQKAEPRESLIHKPTCQPSVPAIPARLGPPPDHLPSHRVIPRRVFKCRISADRHAIVGPWVLWNIWSPVDLGTRKQNAPMRGRLTRQAIDYETDSADPRRDEYDFLMGLSSYPVQNPRLDDLDSELETEALRNLTLWGGEGAVKSRIVVQEGTGVGEEEMVEEMLIL